MCSQAKGEILFNRFSFSLPLFFNTLVAPDKSRIRNVVYEIMRVRMNPYNIRVHPYSHYQLSPYFYFTSYIKQDKIIQKC